MSLSPDPFFLLGNSAAKGSTAPKGRSIPAQGIALGSRHPMKPSPEGAAKGWRTVKLEDVAESIQYGHTTSSTQEAVWPRFLRITDIQDRRVDWETVPYCSIPKNQIPKYRLAKGDLLFARTGATVGKSFLITTEIPESIFASYLIRVRVTDAVDPQFIAYYFQSAQYWQQISDNSPGIGQPNVNGSKLAKITFPLPPLPEQRRIVARIEELFSRLDAGVAALRHAKAQLQRYRQSVLAAAVTGQLTQAWREQHPDTEPASVLLERILEQRREHWNGRGKYKEPVSPNEDFGRNPSGTWEMASMDALTCHITSGSRDWTQYYKDDGYAVFVMAQNVRPQKFDSTPVIRVSPPEGDRDKVRSAVAQDDLLVTIVGANTGNVCRVDKSLEDYYVCQSVALLRPVETATAKYLDLYMNSEEHGQYQFDKWMYGAGRPHLSFDQLRSTAVFLPPLAEQHQIVAEVEARTTAIDHLEAELDRQITRSNRLRQSSLAAAFSGQM